jgi:hypothetical protein
MGASNWARKKKIIGKQIDEILLTPGQRFWQASLA